MTHLLSLVLFSLSLQPLPTPPPAPASASYVRICKNSRGLPDRRACTKTDPERTQLAWAVP